MPNTLLDGAAPDALWVPAGTSIQAVVDALPTLDTFLVAHDLLDRFTTPSALKLGPGTFLERLHIKDRSLRIEGTASPEGPLTVLDGQGSTCPSQSGAVCSTLLVQQSPSVHLRALELRGGAGTPYHVLAPGTSTISVTYGGGIAAIHSRLTLEEVWIEGNTANVGSGIALLGQDSALSLRGSAIAGNESIPREGVLYTGAVYLEQAEDARLFNNTVTDNTVLGESEQGRGGGLAAINVNVDARSNRFEGNSAYSGAGVFVLSTETGAGLTLGHNAIIDNVASASGGGLLLLPAEGTPAGTWRLEGNLIAENVAEAGFGGGISLNGPATVRNNVLSRNYAALGGGGLSYMGDEILQVAQSIFEGNEQAPGASTQPAPDVFSHGAGVHSEASIFLPIAEESLSCGVSHGVSGYFGVEDPQPTGCTSPESLGPLIPPEGSSTPFVAYSRTMPRENIDWHIVPGTLLELRPNDPPSPELDAARIQGQSASELGVYGGEGGRGGLGPQVPDCAEGASIAWWADDAVVGSFNKTDWERLPGSVQDLAEYVLLDTEDLSTVTLELDGPTSAIEVETIPVEGGRCLEEQSLGTRALSPGASTTYDIDRGGLLLLRLSPLSQRLTPYVLRVRTGPAGGGL